MSEMCELSERPTRTMAARLRLANKNKEAKQDGNRDGEPNRTSALQTMTVRTLLLLLEPKWLRSLLLLLVLLLLLLLFGVVFGGVLVGVWAITLIKYHSSRVPS